MVLIKKKTEKLRLQTQLRAAMTLRFRVKSKKYRINRMDKCLKQLVQLIVMNKIEYKCK